jgi:hypothetical protein
LLDDVNWLDTVPNEIMCVILSFLPKTSWFAIMATSKRLFALGRKFFDPSVQNNLAIRRSADRGNVAAVNMLLQDPRVDPSAGLKSTVLTNISRK